MSRAASERWAIEEDLRDLTDLDEEREDPRDDENILALRSLDGLGQE